MKMMVLMSVPRYVVLQVYESCHTHEWDTKMVGLKSVSRYVDCESCHTCEWDTRMVGWKSVPRYVISYVCESCHKYEWNATMVDREAFQGMGWLQVVGSLKL